MNVRRASDDNLAMAVALSTLQMKVKYLERDYLMQYEWNRKQRGELATVMLVRNSNSPDKLNLILDRFLDPTNHCIYGNLNTNAILVRNCSQNHSHPFCSCWRSHEANLNLSALKSRSEVQSRRNSDKTELVGGEQAQFRLQRMGSSTSSVEPHDFNDLSSVTSVTSVTSDSSNKIRSLMDIEWTGTRTEEQRSCSPSRSGSSGLGQDFGNNKYYGQGWSSGGDPRRTISYYGRQNG